MLRVRRTEVELQLGLPKGALSFGGKLRGNEVFLERNGVAAAFDEGAAVGHQRGEVDVVKQEIPVDIFHRPGGPRVRVYTAPEEAEAYTMPLEGFFLIGEANAEQLFHPKLFQVHG